MCNLITQMFTPNVVEVSIGGNIAETPYILMILSMGVSASVLEECLSRGLIFSAFKRSGRIKASILFTSLCFALIHGNINQFAYAFVVGIVMALVVEATDSIITTMAMHFFTNALSITMMYYLYYSDIAIKQTNELLGTGDNKLAELMVDSEAMGMFATMVKITTVLIVAGLAVLGIVGIYKLLGRMALISGRYEHMKSFMPQFGIFRMRNKYIDKMEEANGHIATTDTISDLPRTGIMNIYLAVGIILWIAVAVVYELMVQGVIVIK